MSFHVPQQYRVCHPYDPSADAALGNNGAFVLPARFGQRQLAVLASDGLEWEHVSVHAFIGKHVKSLFTPTWEEMCHVKELFWDLEDVVMQLHPARSQYKNLHPHVLHLWRPIGGTIPTPPRSLV
jgi:hypothetical protein